MSDPYPTPVLAAEHQDQHTPRQQQQHRPADRVDDDVMAMERTVHAAYDPLDQSSGLSSTRCSTTRPSTASTSTKPRRRGGSSVE